MSGNRKKSTNAKIARREVKTVAKRRANGEGNIRKRSDGRWEGRYTAGRDPDTGKVIYKNVLAKTQKECKVKLQRAIEENAKVDAIRAEQYTVGQWLDVWFENCAKIKVRPSSHKTYRGYIDNHIKPSIGKIPLNKLSSLDLQKLHKKLLNGGRVERVESKKQPKGLSAKTVRNINQVISSAMDFAIDQKLIAANPTDGCALPKLEHREMKTLPTEQLASFLHEARERTACSRCTTSSWPPGCGGASCWDSNGRTSTWSGARSRCVARSPGSMAR